MTMETGKRRTLLDVMNEVDRRDEPVTRGMVDDIEARVAELESRLDHTAAVIEAARKLVTKHLRTNIDDDVHGRYLDASLFIGGSWIAQRFYESEKPLPDTVLGAMVELSAAIDAYDESETP